LSHRGPADTEPLDECGLGGDAVARAQSTLLDVFHEAIADLRIQRHDGVAAESRIDLCHRSPTPWLAGDMIRHVDW
jgi:hypothetical protein